MKLLDGIKIIDFTRLLPGPVATHLMAQMGAEVIKVESPKRMDYARFIGPQVDSASILFHQLNHNKRLCLIDYSTEEGLKEIASLIQDADVLIEQFRPGAMEAWGLGFDAVKKINPKIVYASLTGYGQENNYATEAGHDANYLAYSGIMSLMKDKGENVNFSDTQFADISGAYMAIIAIQAALIKGDTCFLDISIADAMNPFLTIPFALHQGGTDYRQFNLINGKTAVNYAAYECKDAKWLAVAALELKFWNNVCEIIGKPEWKRNNGLELMNINFPKSEVEALFKSKTRDEWVALFKGKDTCVTPVLEIEELTGSDFHTDKGTFATFETQNGHKLKGIAPPFKVRY